MWSCGRRVPSSSTATSWPSRPGERLVVDNADPFRHTFTIEGAGVDVEIPAGRTVEVPLDLQPGTYDYICAVPGHEAMTGTLVVGS